MLAATDNKSSTLFKKKTKMMEPKLKIQRMTINTYKSKNIIPKLSSDDPNKIKGIQTTA